MKHNDEQREAIEHIDGPMMVLAGPGAGKTYVITNRVKHLVESGVPADKILVVTFSKAAAVEMQLRFFSVMEGKKLPVRFGTFHSVFFQILQSAYHYEAKDIVTNALRYRFLEETLQEIEYDIEDSREFLLDIEKEISKVKGEGISVDTYYSANCPEEVFRQMYKGYEKRLQAHRALDFDDMVGFTHRLFSEREDILSFWQEKYQYILIDEFQDINRLQYETVKMLARPRNNLFIVGDDDQSIYGFRGSRPEIMLSFPKEYKKAKQILLANNYRSSKEIMNAASHLIENNSRRYKKKLVSVKGRDEMVSVCKCKDTISEANRIVKKIKEYYESGIAYEEMAVLFRTNQQMRLLATKLMENNIPFCMKENVPNIFDSWFAKDMIAYMNIALSDMDRKNFIKIANRPVRYLSRSAFEYPQTSFEDLRQYYRRIDRFWMIERIDEFEEEIQMLSTMTPYSAINFIRKGIGYDDFLKEYAAERNVDPADWLDALDEISDTTREFGSIKDWLDFANNYGEELEKVKQKERYVDTEGVNIMTMHASKGLEFEVVFIPTVNEGVVPYRKAVRQGNIEEERRMLYVAMTRAKKYLRMSFVDERFRKEVEKSRFVDEITHLAK